MVLGGFQSTKIFLEQSYANNNCLWGCVFQYKDTEPFGIHSYRENGKEINNNDLLTVNHSIWDAGSFSEIKVANTLNNRSNSRKPKQRTPVDFNEV